MVRIMKGYEIYKCIKLNAFCSQYRAIHVRSGYKDEIENYPERYKGRNIVVSGSVFKSTYICLVCNHMYLN